MCGRFTLKTPVAHWLADLFPDQNEELRTAIESLPTDLSRPRFNITPSQSIVVARCNDHGVLLLEGMRWGLVPKWATSLSGGYNMINARSESIAEKPSFRPSLIEKRCVVLTDGYYEWKKLTPKVKEPYWIHTAGEQVFAMAGLWAENRKIEDPVSKKNSIVSATIITTQSNTDVASVHDRMPAVLLNQAQIADWLDTTHNSSAGIDRLLEQLQPCPLGVLQLRRVSTLVNSPANDSALLLDHKD